MSENQNPGIRETIKEGVKIIHDGFVDKKWRILQAGSLLTATSGGLTLVNIKVLDLVENIADKVPALGGVVQSAENIVSSFPHVKFVQEVVEPAVIQLPALGKVVQWMGENPDLIGNSMELGLAAAVFASVIGYCIANEELKGQTVFGDNN